MGSGGKPYVPSKDTKEKKSHWFRNLVLLGLLRAGGYYVYKRRFSSFNFVQYRPMGRNANLGNGMYGGFFGDDGGGASSAVYSNLNQSTTFEPPTLPPTPTQMGTEMT